MQIGKLTDVLNQSFQNLLRRVSLLITWFAEKEFEFVFHNGNVKPSYKERFGIEKDVFKRAVKYVFRVRNDH